MDPTLDRPRGRNPAPCARLEAAHSDAVVL